MGFKESLSNNNFRKIAGRAGLAFAAGAMAMACDSDQKPTPITQITPTSLAECNLTSLDRVKKGLIKPQEYIQSQYKCLPEVIQAEKSGILKGFLYEPSDSELEARLREIFSSRTDSEEALQYFVKSSVDGYNSTKAKGHAAGILVPGIVGIFGEGIPMYVAFTEELSSSPSIKNEADIRSIIKHELQHVEDEYNGITLGDIHLSYNTISQETFSLAFLEELMELRAVYKELEAAFKEKVETGKVSISPEWFGSQAANYSKHFDYIDKSAKTPLEKRVRELQLKEFKGITPQTKTDSIVIKFNLFGKQDSAVIKRSTP